MQIKKFLIVDDDKQVTEGIGAFLKALGYDTLLATESEQALKYIGSEKLSLVLLDIQLPRINGIEILSILRKKHPDVKVFVITAYSKDVKTRCEEIGFDEFFEKPIDLDSLMESIASAVSQEKIETIEEEAPQTEIAVVAGSIPAAKCLFIEPNVKIYGYTCGLFGSKDFNKGDYEIKVVFSLEEAMELDGPNSVYTFHPDIVVMYDFDMKFEDLMNFADYMAHISFKPKKIIIHGVLPRSDFEILQLKKKNIAYCSQAIFNDEDLIKMNKKLIDFVGKECLKYGLCKKP